VEVQLSAADANPRLAKVPQTNLVASLKGIDKLEENV
jgi:hypothetical protein